MYTKKKNCDILFILVVSLVRVLNVQYNKSLKDSKKWFGAVSGLSAQCYQYTILLYNDIHIMIIVYLLHIPDYQRVDPILLKENFKPVPHYDYHLVHQCKHLCITSVRNKKLVYISVIYFWFNYGSSYHGLMWSRPYRGSYTQ